MQSVEQERYEAEFTIEKEDQYGNRFALHCTGTEEAIEQFREKDPVSIELQPLFKQEELSEVVALLLDEGAGMNAIRVALDDLLARRQLSPREDDLAWVQDSLLQANLCPQAIHYVLEDIQRRRALDAGEGPPEEALPLSEEDVVLEVRVQLLEGSREEPSVLSFRVEGMELASCHAYEFSDHGQAVVSCTTVSGYARVSLYEQSVNAAGQRRWDSRCQQQVSCNAWKWETGNWRVLVAGSSGSSYRLSGDLPWSGTF